MEKYRKYKMEIILSLLTFWYVISLCIYSNVVRIILKFRAEHLTVHLIFFNTSFVINAQDTSNIGTFPIFHYFQIALINNAVMDIFYIIF